VRITQCMREFARRAKGKVVRRLRGRPTLTVAVIVTALIAFLHPALGLIVLILSHAWCCHTALCSFLAPSFRSHQHRKGEWQNSKFKADIFPQADSSMTTGVKLEDNHSPVQILPSALVRHSWKHLVTSKACFCYIWLQQPC